MTPTFFAKPADFRRWLTKHHRSETELWVGFYKKDSGRPSITWPESVDEALCFGWIDGIRKSLDAESYVIRFTPRRRDSIWSNVNIGRVQVLTDEGRMKPAGLEAFKERKAAKSGVYAYEVPKLKTERDSAALDATMEKQFKAQPAAWKFYNTQPPGYRKLCAFWIISAKREETRAKRLEILIADSAAGRRIAGLRKPTPGASS